MEVEGVLRPRSGDFGDQEEFKWDADERGERGCFLFCYHEKVLRRVIRSLRWRLEGR
jgi:hypothetical protein